MWYKTEYVLILLPVLVDHVGNMKTFPGSVKLIVGPGFKSNFTTGYPTNKDSPLLDADWEGRELVEIEFKSELEIGGFKANDYFGDGSFYLLNAPGHTVGHLCGFARVSKGSNDQEDTFVLIGGDACHHGETLKFSDQYLHHFLMTSKQVGNGNLTNISQDRSKSPFLNQFVANRSALVASFRVCTATIPPRQNITRWHQTFRITMTRQNRQFTA
jgi:hypothetical protein